MNIDKNKLWVINKNSDSLDRVDLELKKQLIFKPMIPMQLPKNIGLKYVKKYNGISICDHPEMFFAKRSLKQLICRDAGIGDLLLLEPVIRQLYENDKRDITIACCYPDIFKNNYHISNCIEMQGKYDIKQIDYEKYDAWEDLRSYSETCNNRDKKHRTDIYNEKWEVDIKDKEPRLYFDKKEKSKLKKKDKYDYIGLQMDASHSYRRYEKNEELIKYILDIDKKNVVVLLGHCQYVKIKKNKRIIDLQGNTTIREVINIIRELDYMIAVDSGLMHIALTLHIPTVCIFSIITSDFRIRYYTGEYRVLSKALDCLGCGDHHMQECRYGSKKKDVTFIPKCMNFQAKEFYDKILEMKKCVEPRVFYPNGHKKIIQKDIQFIVQMSQKTLTMPIIVLNEEKNLPRFIDNVIKNKWIGRIIVIDGGSTDNTVKLLRKAGAYVYVHPYDVSYHDMQALQRNISCSFVKDNEKIIIMDIDECFSDELADYLPLILESNIEYGQLSRKTFNYYADITDISKQIKDYPDYQPRVFTWQRTFKWAGSPHHELYNAPAPVRIKKDILHFEKEGKDRNELEKKWLVMQKKSAEVYG